MFLNKRKKLYISQIIRVIASFIILFILKAPLYMKILLVMTTDAIDCGIPNNIIFESKKWVNCKKKLYKKSDKITDTICYSMLLYYILVNCNLSSKYKYILILLFIYRLIGVYIFLIKNNSTYLFYFPNFFLEISLVLSLINSFLILKNFEIIIILFVVIYKMIQEYYLHILKK